MENKEVIKDEEELGKALKEGKDEIVIEGRLAKFVIKIKVTEKIAWAIAFATIAIVVIVVITSRGSAAPVSALTGESAVSILGIATAILAASIAIAAKDPQVLNKLRKEYEIVEKNENRAILKKINTGDLYMSKIISPCLKCKYRFLCMIVPIIIRIVS